MSKETRYNIRYACSSRSVQLDKATAVVADKRNISLHPPVDCQAFTPSAADANSYDAVFSNAVLHWCKRDPGGVLETVKKLLKPGGRLAAEFGGYMCLIGMPPIGLSSLVHAESFGTFRRPRCNTWSAPPAQH